MPNNYNQTGLNNLLAAVILQAEQDVIDAIHRDFPGLAPEQEKVMMDRYKKVCRMAEQRIVMSTMQGEKK